MPQRFSFEHLPLSLLWTFFGMPLCIFAGVIWDGFKDPASVQTFLGASNNIFFFFMLPVGMLMPLKIIVDAALGRKPSSWPVLFVLPFLAWAIFGLWMSEPDLYTGELLIPFVALVVITAGVVLHQKAREVIKNGHVSDLHALVAWSLFASSGGLLLSLVVHLMGAMPDKQVFLRVDGFGNIRTLGETALLCLMIGLALNTRRYAMVPFLLAIAMAMVLAWSGTRAAWVGLGATLVVGAVWWRVSFGGLLRWGLALALGFTLSSFLPLPDSNYGLFRAVSVVREATTVVTDIGALGVSTAQVDTEQSDSNRLALWSWGVERIQESPWYGRGYAAMSAIPDRPDHANFVHLHNLPLDLMFGLGVPVGAALTLLLAWMALLSIHRSRRSDHVLLPMIACGTLVTSLFAGVFLFPITVVAVAVGLASAYAGPTAHPET